MMSFRYFLRNVPRRRPSTVKGLLARRRHPRCGASFGGEMTCRREPGHPYFHHDIHPDGRELSWGTDRGRPVYAWWIPTVVPGSPEVRYVVDTNSVETFGSRSKWVPSYYVTGKGVEW